MMQESLKGKKIKITMILIWFYHSKTNVATQSDTTKQSVTSDIIHNFIVYENYILNMVKYVL